jgi:hypothetical protein
VNPNVCRHHLSGAPAISRSKSSRRPYLDPIEIARIIARPARRVRQADGRIRLHGFASSLYGSLRVVLLADGEAVNNAFIDEDYAP